MGYRTKKVLIDLAYQRVPDEKKLDLEVLDKYGSPAVHELGKKE